MGLRLKKSINLGGGFRVNLSKSGVGYSWGTKGFRTTKMANGKKRNTYSIPGTGISYVDEKGKVKSAYDQNKTVHEDSDFSDVDSTVDYKSTMSAGKAIKTLLGTIFGIIVLLILLAYFPAVLLLAGIAAIVYLATHKQYFSEKSSMKKVGISVLIVVLILFGAVGTFS